MGVGKNLPDKCGGIFQYAVTGYEKFANNSVGKAISTYLSTILNGLTVAKTWIESPLPIVARPTSGKKLYIDQQEIPAKLLGSATIADFPFASRSERMHWDLAQGEIFSCTLNMSKLIEALTPEADYVAFNTDNNEVHVVVKVSSRAVHCYLNESKNAIMALNWINSKREKGQTALDLSPVLFAVFRVPRGMITIMADLSPTFRLLRPCKDQKHRNLTLSVLWNAFENLVMNVLFPMACLKCIHPDIRPGYDITSNILCEVAANGEQATMRLVDYESIVFIDQWTIPKKNDHRYIQPKSDAKMFLWWQCFSVFYSWKERKSQRKMKGISLESLLLAHSDVKVDGDDSMSSVECDDMDDEDRDGEDKIEEGDEETVAVPYEREEVDDETTDARSNEADGESERPEWFDTPVFRNYGAQSVMDEAGIKLTLERLGQLFAVA